MSDGAGGKKTITISLNQTDTISNFTGFGLGTAEANAAETDILKFSGANLTAANMIFTAAGATDIEISFANDPTGTKVVLAGFASKMDTLDNVIVNGQVLGNFLFNGETKLKDGIDIWDASNANDSVVKLTNGVTFLFNAKDDLVFGKDKSNDVINGLDGNDVLKGLGGDDILRGALGSDTLFGGDGKDVLDGGLGNNILVGGKGDDIYIVSSATDIVIENLGLKAGGGKDIVKSSVDFALGANIENLTFLASATATGKGNELDNTITATAGATLYGFSGNDVLNGATLNGLNTLIGGLGNDKLIGGAVSNILDGGSGADIMIGGVGGDDYFVDSIKDKVVEANNGDPSAKDRVYSAVSISLASLPNIEEVTLTGFAAIDATGSKSSNYLTGNTAANRLDGGAGADTLLGGAGNDTYVFDNIMDRVISENLYTDTGDTVILNSAILANAFSTITVLTFGNFGGVENVTYKGNLDWTFSGDAGVNILIGGSGANNLMGLDGDDHLVGGGKVDNLIGGNGADILDGGKGNDTLAGGGGDNADDTYVIDSAGDIIIEGGDASSHDRVLASISIDLNSNLGDYAKIEDVVLTGKAKLNAIGNTANNHLTGNGADNILEGRGGDDILEGGAGIDIAKFAGSKTDYTIANGQITDNQAAIDGDDGKDTLIGIEILEFKDGKIFAPNKIIDSDSTIKVLTENAIGDNMAVGITAKASDPDSSTFVYSLTGDAGGRFTIDSSSGIVKTTQGSLFDFEDHPSYTIRIRATDGLGLYTEQDFTIKIADTKGDRQSIIDLGALTAAKGAHIDGAVAGNFIGNSVAGIGDMNGDGLADFVIGARSANFGVGEAYVVFGKAGGFGAGFDISALDGLNGFRLDGYSLAGIGALGAALSGAGDINGDGFDDLIIGAPLTDIGASTDIGSTFIIFGKAGGFAADFDLSALDGKNGLRLDGTQFGDQAGFSVAGAGDVDGDGIDDLIVGAPYADPNAASKAGSAFVLYGKADWSSTNGALSLNQADAQFDSAGANYSAGTAVDGIGDFNGDGIEDFAIGSRSANGSGSAYIVFGQAGGVPSLADLAALGGTDGFAFYDSGSTAASLGTSLSAAGDINGDGFADLIVGARDANSPKGAAYVLFGKADWSGISQFDAAALDGKNGFRLDGGPQSYYTGVSVSGAGDFNGDGFGDFLVGAYGSNIGSNFYAGETFLVFGKADWSAGAGSFAVDQMANGEVIRLTGVETNDHSGRSASFIGDANGDGFDDILIGADSASPNGQLYAGSSYIIYGGNVSGAVTKTGTAKNDVIKGKPAGGEVFVGGLGDDSFASGGGADVFYGGAGNDSLDLAGASGLKLFDGGGGIDRLKLDAFRLLSDFTDDAALKGRVADVEILDLGGTHANALRIDSESVAHMPGANGAFGFGANQIVVMGDSNDTIILSGGGWARIGVEIDPNNIAGRYLRYSDGQASILVDADMLIEAPLLNLADLDIARGVSFSGRANGDQAGRAVGSAGDINGDGYDDFLIGALNADPVINNNAGSSYLVFGKADWSGAVGGMALGALNAADGFRLDGVATTDQSGSSVASAGDINGDGYDDLIIGARFANAGDGGAYIMFGKAGGFAPVLDLAQIASSKAGLSLAGDSGTGELAGWSVSGIGDIDGDGYDDFLIGAFNAGPNANALAGSAYLIFGASDLVGADIDLGTMTASTNVTVRGFRIDGLATGDYVGSDVSSAGDVNGDGYADFIIGAAGVSTKAGATYLIFGGSGLASVDLANLGTHGVIFSDANANDFSGYSVSGLGDINGDGYDDLVIGAHQAHINGTASGASYIVFGSANPSDIADLNAMTNEGFQINGIDNFDRVGRSVSGAGDINGDGYDDILVGADAVNGYIGAAYVVFGAADIAGIPDFGDIDGSNGFALAGIAPNDKTGFSVSGAGDVNGDGFDDLLVGAYNADPNNITNAGAAYVVFGGNLTGAVTHLGGAGADKLTGTAAAESFVGGGGNDILTGNGGADSFQGGAGNDVIRLADSQFHRVDGGGGQDILAFDYSGAIDFAILRNRVSDIEVLSVDNKLANALMLHVGDLLDLDPANVNVGGKAALDNLLKLDGNTGDTLALTATDGWSATIDKTSLSHYAVYSIPSANGGILRLAVDTDIIVTVA